MMGSARNRPTATRTTTGAILRIVLPYALFAGLWVFLSDRLLDALPLEPGTHTQWSTYKGWAFVLVTALLLWTLLRTELGAREKARAAQRRSEEQLRLLGDNLPDSYVYQYTRDADGTPRFLYLSSGVERLHGVKAEEALQDAGLLRRQIDPDQVPTLQEAEMESLRNLTDFTIELRVCRSDGQWRWIQICSRPRRASDGRVLWDGVATDITGRRQAETERNQLSHIIERSLNEIFVFDPHTLRFRHVNQGALKNLQYTLEEIKELTPYDLKPEFNEEGFRAMIEPLLSGKQEFLTFETVHRRADGSLYPVEVNLQLVNAEEDRVFLAVIFDITERRRVEEELRQSESLYHSLFALGPDGIVILDPETASFIHFNDQACRQLGYTREEFSRLRITDIELMESPEATAARIQKVIREGYDEFDTMQRTKQGEPRNIRVTAQYSIVGEKHFYHCIWRDITKQKKEEQILEARLHLIEYSLSHSLDDLLTETVNKVEELTGSLAGFYHFIEEDQSTLSLHAWSTRTRSHLCSVEGTHRHYRIEEAGVWVDCVHQRKPVIHNDYATLADRKGFPPGHVPMIRELVVPIFRSDRIVGILGIGNKSSDYTDEDISVASRLADFSWEIAERKQIQESLRESDEKFSAAFNNAPVMISISSLDDRTYLDVNQLFLHTLGYLRGEVIGKTSAELGLESHAERAHLLDAIRKDGRVQEIELKLRAKSGKTILCKYWGEIITIAGQKRLLSISLDITEQRKVEEQFLQAQKMESVGRLAGGVAHDFNNMLSVILGHAELALMKLDPGQPIIHDLLEIHEAAERSADLTRQLLAFARKQTIAPLVLDLNVTVAGMLKMLKRLIGEDIDLAWMPGAGVWPVRMDPSQLDQIMANLCVNARDAIAGVGKITIETATARFDEDYCANHAGFVPGEFALLAVSDDGSGMDGETMTKIFDPFFTTKEMSKGTGLGLSMVYGIIKQNSGFINVYSEPGHGTTFKIYLPRHAEMGASPQGHTPEPAARGHETILLVEDESAILDLGKEMLESLGYAVLAAGTPDEAIRLAEEHAGEIPLLLTDVIMPRMNGRDLAQKLQTLYPNLTCLFMSGYTADVIAHRGVLGEGVHFIEKPFSMQTLSAKVREILDKR